MKILCELKSVMHGSVVANGGLQGIGRLSRSYDKSDDIRCYLQGRCSLMSHLRKS